MYVLIWPEGSLTGIGYKHRIPFNIWSFFIDIIYAISLRNRSGRAKRTKKKYQREHFISSPIRRTNREPGNPAGTRDCRSTGSARFGIFTTMAGKCAHADFWAAVFWRRFRGSLVCNTKQTVAEFVET